jgi:hypothetical protein
VIKAGPGATADSRPGWLEKTDRITLHDPESGKAGTYGGLPAVPTFDDTKDWYVAPGEQPEANGWAVRRPGAARTREEDVRRR